MFTLEDWERINTDAEKFFKREDRGVVDDFKQKLSEGTSTINNAASDAYNTAGEKINQAGDKISGVYDGVSNTVSEVPGKLNDTWNDIKFQYNETRNRIETFIKIVKILLWVFGFSIIFLFIGAIVLIIYSIKHHKTKNRRQRQRIEDLTNAVNNLTKVYCRNNNIDYADNEEVVQLTIDGEEEKPALNKIISEKEE